jgi:hypothetical protein
MKKLRGGEVLTIFILSCFLSFQSFSQHQKVEIDESAVTEKYLNTTASEIKVQELSNDIDHANLSLRWMREVHTLKPNIEHEVPEPGLLESLKEEKNELKKKAEQSGFRQSEDIESTNAVKPILGTNFKGNLATQGTPPDNTMAISNGGIIVSAINSNIIYFDKYGNEINSMTFNDFFNDDELNSKIYDPVVIYDSGKDRFIFVVLHGSSSETSMVLVSFSKTNNPNDGWFTYYLNTSDIYNNRWFDFPRVGISENELFISGNIFYDGENGGFSESLIYQIDKSDGYYGLGLSYRTWNNLRDPNFKRPFTMVPLSYGHSGNYGPGIYFVSNNSAEGSSIFLWDLTNELNKNPELNVYKVATDHYEIGADAYQKYTSSLSPGLLDVGDCRIHHGFYLDGIIHFVFHSQFNSQGYNGINYNRLDVNTLKNTSKVFGMNSYDMAFPSVASSAAEYTKEKDVIIAYLQSGSDIYPQFRTLQVDEDMNQSTTTLIQEGTTWVDMLLGNERWGDYTGIQRKHNTSAPEIWVSGCFGTRISESHPAVAHGYKTWIAMVKDNNSNSIEESIKIESKIYPNPVYEMFNIEFTLNNRKHISIDIFDTKGKLC